MENYLSPGVLLAVVPKVVPGSNPCQHLMEDTAQAPAVTVVSQLPALHQQLWTFTHSHHHHGGEGGGTLAKNDEPRGKETT